jgi:CBS domain-containing protein
MMESLKVQAYMNHYPVTFTPGMMVEEASLRFLKTKQIGGPVIDKNKKLVGFLSEGDVLAKMLKSIYHNEHVTDVTELMTIKVLTVKPYDSIIELAQDMLEKNHKIYPVVDDDNKLMGTISRNDVLRAIDIHMELSYKHSA